MTTLVYVGFGVLFAPVAAYFGLVMVGLALEVPALERRASLPVYLGFAVALAMYVGAWLILLGA